MSESIGFILSQLVLIFGWPVGLFVVFGFFSVLLCVLGVGFAAALFSQRLDRIHADEIEPAVMEDFAVAE